MAMSPTVNSAVNALIGELQSSIHAIIGDDLIGLYLDGSLALGDFDADSDIDFVAVVTDEITGDSPWVAAARSRINLASQYRTRLWGTIENGRS